MKGQKTDQSSSSSSSKDDQHDNKQKLSELVKQADFTDKDSISYNAAMYFLLEILEEKIKQLGSKKAGEIGILRNGLVHGFTAIDPKHVKSFINAGIEESQFNLNKIKIEKTDLFKQARTRNSMPDSIKSDRNDVMPEADKSPFNKVAFEKTKSDITKSRQEQMRRQKANINTFNTNKDNPFAPYATLYSAGCFCEAA